MINNSSNYYQLYIDKVLMLAQTIVIKSEDTVNGLNTFVNDQATINGTATVNTLAPKTWKYYLNVSGQYHYLDIPMYVVSIDTQQKILFNLENLALHVATATAYQFGSRLYKLLVSQFPTQEILIKGILYPVNIDEAISALDGTILGYPSNLVESNEYSLITKLQTWINGYKVRWVNQQYGVSDSLYPATSLGIMYLNLVPTILNLRLEACKTNEAHSFHIHQYLASHGLLNNYIDNMTTKQALFFYRNIAYIERNSGKKSTFDWLLENVMTARNLPLAEYLMQHNLLNQPENNYPDIVFNKKSLNNQYDADMGSTFSLLQILTKEDTLAKDNIKYKDDSIVSIQETMENSLSNTVLTKVLESVIVDTTDSAPYTMNETLLNHWLYLSTKGIYTAYITVINPKTGEVISVTVAEAFTLAWYVFCASINIIQTTVPVVIAKRVQRIVPLYQNYKGMPSNVVDISDIMSVTDNKLVDISVGKQILSFQPEMPTSIISTQAFYNTCKNIYAACQEQRNLIATQQHNIGRSMTLGAVSSIYGDTVCNLAPNGQLYTDWFKSRNIDVSTLNPIELNTLYINIFQQATGLALNTTSSLKDMQNAMISVFQQLSSYTIQVVGTINNTVLQRTDWTAVRVGDMLNSSSEYQYIPDCIVEIKNIKTSLVSNAEHIVGDDKYIRSIDSSLSTIGATNFKSPITDLSLKISNFITH